MGTSVRGRFFYEPTPNRPIAIFFLLTQFIFSLYTLPVMASYQFILHGWVVFFTTLAIPLCTSTLVANSQTYIVHMDKGFMPKAFPDHHSWYRATVDSLSSPELASPQIIYSYEHLDGFSVLLTPSELEALKKCRGYLASTPDSILNVKLDTTHTPKFIGLNHYQGAWPAARYGEDVIIGVVDTGIWPESRSFHDERMTGVPKRWKGLCESGKHFNASMCNKKLIGARSFYKGLISLKPNMTISMKSARDTDGHGTHTSSTAAGGFVKGASYFGYALGTSAGAAPKARVAMYKTMFDEDEDGASSDIMSAIDQAIADGVDVLSISQGLDNVSLEEDPFAIATFAAMKKGIFVSMSAGNGGPSKAMHNGTPWVLTVAAGTVDRELGGSVVLDSRVSIHGKSLYSGSPGVDQVPIALIAQCQNASHLKRHCGKLLICEEDKLAPAESLYDQINAVEKTTCLAGAIFISGSAYDINFLIETSFAALFVNTANGKKLINYVKTKRHAGSHSKAALRFRQTFLRVKPSPIVNDYSSRGPSPSCREVLKPDILAPGTMILASWPTNVLTANLSSKLLYNEFILLSGTSMACPHASGVAALLKGVHRDWSPAAIRSAMMTTAELLDNAFEDIKENQNGELFPATPLAMGSGHINPNKALDPGLIYDATAQDYIDLLCALNYTSKQIRVITRTDTQCSYPLPPPDLNYPSFIAFIKKKNSRVEFRRTLTNVENLRSSKVRTYKVSVPTIDGFHITVKPKELTFNRAYQQKTYNMVIEGPIETMKNETVAYGFLKWVDIERKYEVKSPIVLTNTKP